MAEVTKAQREKSKLTKEEWREYTKTVWHIPNVSHAKHPATFPEEIPRRLIQLFSFHGELVLDPFGGVGTTAKAGVPLGRRVMCVDQNQTYVDIMNQECGALLNGRADALTAVRGDSRELDQVADASVDLVVTSPPYWNKADYGKGKANLGAIAGYSDFLEAIRPVFEECYRVLQPGRKFCINTANVNQHTDHGLLTFPLATDFAVIAREVGFVMINEIIWSKDKTGGRWGSANGQRPIFGSYPYPPNFLFKNVHEYVLIFAKPPKQKTKGPKVLPYAKLMNRTLQRHQNKG
jgi:site-specific DNA-methyltransferase (adenine-specific)